ncbi:Barstar (barnase inhibitor) [Actinobacteria bacterium OV450]|nr:Barstar (barnase inhibitor) [Actinobacteria bacterium OV450]
MTAANPPAAQAHRGSPDGPPAVDALFRQFRDGLRLPDHPGWNRDALHDCLRDLGRLSADQVLPAPESFQAGPRGQWPGAMGS